MRGSCSGIWQQFCGQKKSETASRQVACWHGDSDEAGCGAGRGFCSIARGRVRFRTGCARRTTLLADADAEGFHLAVEMAALEAEQFGGMAYVVAGFFNLLEDVFALVGVAGLLQA